MLTTRCALAVALAAGLAAPALAQPVPVTLVAIEGQDVGDGITITGMGDPYTNALGQVGFIFNRSDATTARGIWIGSGSVFSSTAILPYVASGGEPTIGISNAGDFIYSPTFNGGDAVVTSHGKLLSEQDVLPGMPGFFSRFNSRPRMASNGTAFWVGGFTSIQGGSTEGYVFLRCTDTSDPATITPGIRTGDLIDGRPIGASGVVFNFEFSDDATQVINSIDLDGATADDALMLVNGTTIVAREGQPTGAGDNWANFDDPGINNSGNYIFSGDTDSAITTADGYLAYNGQIALREGSVLDGVTLAGNPLDLSIDNNNRVAFIWGPSTTSDRRRALYIGTAPDLAGTAAALLRTDAEVDTTGDGVADYTVQTINIGAGPGMELADTGLVYVSAELRPIGGAVNFEAIIGIQPPGGAPECPTDWNGDDSVNSSDISSFLTAWLDSLTQGNLNADFNEDNTVNSGDISAFLTQWIADVTGGNC